jgi:hypothetical protein
MTRLNSLSTYPQSMWITYPHSQKAVGNCGYPVDKLGISCGYPVDKHTSFLKKFS